MHGYSRSLLYPDRIARRIVTAIFVTFRKQTTGSFCVGISFDFVFSHHASRCVGNGHGGDVTPAIR